MGDHFDGAICDCRLKLVEAETFHSSIELQLEAVREKIANSDAVTVDGLAHAKAEIQRISTEFVAEQGAFKLAKLCITKADNELAKQIRHASRKRKFSGLEMPEASQMSMFVKDTVNAAGAEKLKPVTLYSGSTPPDDAPEDAAHSVTQPSRHTDASMADSLGSNLPAHCRRDSYLSSWPSRG